MNTIYGRITIINYTDITCWIRESTLGTSHTRSVEIQETQAVIRSIVNPIIIEFSPITGIMVQVERILKH